GTGRRPGEPRAVPPRGPRRGRGRLRQRRDRTPHRRGDRAAVPRHAALVRRDAPDPDREPDAHRPAHRAGDRARRRRRAGRGELPFPGNSAMAVMMSLANRTPEPAAAKNPSVPRAVSDLVARLLEKQPEARVQTAGAVVRELDAAIAALSGQAPTVPIPAPTV